MKYNKDLLLKATFIEFMVAFLVAACMVDSTVYEAYIYFCLAVSGAWLVLFGVANECWTF